MIEDFIHNTHPQIETWLTSTPFTRVNSKGENVHPAMIPISRCWHTVLNSNVLKHICLCWEKASCRFMTAGTLKIQMLHTEICGTVFIFRYLSSIVLKIVV